MLLALAALGVCLGLLLFQLDGLAQSYTIAGAIDQVNVCL